MTKETWEQIEQLWKQATQLPPRQREAFVKNATTLNEQVRQEVLAMLRQSDDSEDFLETPAIEEAARQLAHDKLNAPTLEMRGQRYGAYEIIAELGAGGMGAVYLARDLNLQRVVALKVLPELFARDPDRIKRFKREAEMLARVNHPNVATLFDYDREAGDEPRYLVMEYVQGETLEERLQRSKLTVEAAAPIFRQIAEALHAAHVKGVIHRDLKPSNIKITPEGTVKVLDFGLAKQTPKPATAESGAGLGPATRFQTITQRQMILGTPGYMSPEQVRGDKDLDQRTDWWAFGCMFYEALTGQNPFRADSNADTQAAILTKEPNWNSLPFGTPPKLVKLIHRCLDKDLSCRVRQASEVLPLLANLKAPGRLLLAALHLKRLAPQLGLVAAGVVVLAGLYVGYLWLKPRPTTLLAVIAEPEAASCEPGRSAAIAKLVNDKLKDLRGLKLIQPLASDRSQPFLMIDADLTQTALTAEANTILKVAATNCTDGQQAIKYSLVSKQGQALVDGTATEFSQMLLSVVTALDLSGDARQWQASDSDAEYYRAVALLESYLNENAVEDAIKLLRAIKPTGQTAEARISAALGWAHFLKFNLSKRIEDREQATSAAERAKSLAGNDSEVLLFCGETSISLGNIAKAIADFEAVLRQRPDDPKAIVGLARAYEHQADFAKAEEQYLKAVALRNDNWEMYNEMGGFYFDRGEFQKAEAAWRKVTELLENNPFGFNNLGVALLYQEKYDPAMAMFYEALKRKRLPATYHNLGTANLFRGACDRAVEEFRKGKELDSQDAEFWGAEGEALSCSASQTAAAKSYNQAIAMLTQIEIAGDADALSLLAEWYARRNQKQLAEQKIEEALLLEPNNYDCIVSAVKVYKLTNEPDKLMAQLQKAVQNRKSLFEVKHDPLLKEMVQQEKYHKLLTQ